LNVSLAKWTRCSAGYAPKKWGATRTSFHGSLSGHRPFLYRGGSVTLPQLVDVSGDALGRLTTSSHDFRTRDCDAYPFGPRLFFAT